MFFLLGGGEAPFLGPRPPLAQQLLDAASGHAVGVQRIEDAPLRHDLRGLVRAEVLGIIGSAVALTWVSFLSGWTLDMRTTEGQR